MNLILHLPPETEALLKSQAEATGKAPEEFALSALQAQLREATGRPKQRSRRTRQKLTPEEWIADIRKWSESHDHGVVNADDSRESIYDGCGE
jgi:hypothetical protein